MRSQSSQRVVLDAFFDARALHGAAQDRDSLIVNAAIDGIGMAIFTAVSETELGGIFPRCRRAVGYLGDQGEGAQRFGADAGHGEQSLKITGVCRVSFEQDFFDGFRVQIFDLDLVMRWKTQGL